MAWQYDHALHRAYNGFRMLTLGFLDGHSFIPADFSLLSGSNKVGKDASSDQRTSGGIRQKEARMTSPALVVEMVASALTSGVYASHVLMDSCFTFSKLLTQLTEIGTHVIGMVKKSKTKYLYQGKLYRLTDLYQKSTKESRDTAVISTISVKLQTGIPVRIIFVHNRNKKSLWFAIMITDMTLSSQEIVKLYGIRWDIETFF